MVQDGNITAKDAIRHAEALNSIKARVPDMCAVHIMSCRSAKRAMRSAFC